MRTLGPDPHTTMAESFMASRAIRELEMPAMLSKSLRATESASGARRSVIAFHVSSAERSGIDRNLRATTVMDSLLTSLFCGCAESLGCQPAWIESNVLIERACNRDDLPHCAAIKSNAGFRRLRQVTVTKQMLQALKFGSHSFNCVL